MSKLKIKLLLMKFQNFQMIEASMIYQNKINNNYNCFVSIKKVSMKFKIKCKIIYHLEIKNYLVKLMKITLYQIQ